MTLISYARNAEDILLWRAFQTVEKGFFIDVGANAPQQDSVTYLFYEQGWRGVNIEPVVQWYEMLAEVRPEDINLNAAIASQSTLLTLHEEVDTGRMTLDAQHAANHYHSAAEGLTHTVAAFPLETVCQRYAPATIHFLRIGSAQVALMVLQSLNLARYRPQIILVASSAELLTELNQLLLDNGYEHAYFDGQSRFYIAKECPQLHSAFATPPQAQEGFKPYREILQLQQIERLQAQLDAERQLSASVDFRPVDLTVLEPLAWAATPRQGEAAAFQQVGAGIRLVFQQQERMEQAMWRLAQLQAKQTALEAERLRQQQADYQRRIFDLEQENRYLQEQQQRLQQDQERAQQESMRLQQQWQQQLQQERLHFQHQQELLLRDKEIVVRELQGVYHGNAWRLTKPLRVVADGIKPIFRKVRDGSSAWIRLTPESRPRRTARRIKQMVKAALGRIVRKGKAFGKRYPLVDKSMRAGLERFPTLRHRLKRVGGLNPPVVVVSRYGGQVSNLSDQAASVYRKLQSNNK